MLSRIGVSSLLGWAMIASAAAQEGMADLQAGAELAGACAACHGPDGISTGDQFPNLAAQKEAYLAAQLGAFRSGDRENALMNAVAASLSDAEIANLAGHFASLPGAEPGEAVANLSGLDGTLPTFPESREGFVEYHRIDFEDRKQVRAYLANADALAAAGSDDVLPPGSFLLVEIFAAAVDADGNLTQGDDGRMVAGELTGYTAMEKQGGWGEGVPEILRNGDWRYAVFDAQGGRRDGVNEGPCLACHVPLTDADYTFTLGELRAKAKAD
jgi:cytochrome c553